MYHIRNGHPPDLPGRAQNGRPGSQCHHKENESQSSVRNRPGSSPACGHQPAVQEPVDWQAESTSKHAAKECIGGSLRAEHFCKLSAAHSNGPHSPILPHPRGGVHGNAVDDMKAGNKHNYREKAV